MLKTVKTFCVQVLKARPEIRINWANTLGWRVDANWVVGPIIAHILDDLYLKNLLLNTRLLKTTGFAVHPDFSHETRNIQAKLMQLRAEINKYVSGKHMSLMVDCLWEMKIVNQSWPRSLEGMLEICWKYRVWNPFQHENGTSTRSIIVFWLVQLWVI